MFDYLQRFSPEQQKQLKEIINVLKLSFSNQQKFLEYIYEILRIDESLNFTKLIENLNIKEILANKNIQGKEKGKKIIEKLFELRFPETSDSPSTPFSYKERGKHTSNPFSSQEKGQGMSYQPEIIYIEKEIEDLEYTKHILSKFPNIKKEIIKDINKLIKSKKNIIYDKSNQPLLLAKQRGKFLEKCPGTKEHICCNYYTLNIAVGCPFDCTYCFLQSYTNNPFYTVYVNMEDMLAEIKQKVPVDKKIRIGTGEFTDSLALEEFTDFAKTYVPLILKNNPNIILELKTKSANIAWLKNIGFQDQLVIAWSVNPQDIAAGEEKYSAPLLDRINAAKTAIDLGYKIALHFDPIIYQQGWEDQYKQVIELLKVYLDPKKIYWLSLGILRFTPLLKPIVEKKFPESKIIYGEFFPGKDKKMRYPEPIRINIYQKMLAWLKEWDKDIPVYFCMESAEVWLKIMNGPPHEVNILNHLFC